MAYDPGDPVQPPLLFLRGVHMPVAVRMAVRDAMCVHKFMRVLMVMSFLCRIFVDVKMLMDLRD